MSLVDELHEQIETNRAKVLIGKQLQRLMLNKDFKALIVDGYIANLALSNVEQLAHYDKDCIDYKLCIDELNAISHLQKYLHGLQRQAEFAEQSLNEAMDTNLNEDTD